MYVTHLTVGTPFKEMINLLKSQSIENGFRFINLSSNMKRGTVGFYEKIRLVDDFLSTSSIHDDEIILFTDGYDVSILDNYKNIISKFLSMDCDVLFNAEKNFWPSLELYPNIENCDRSLIKRSFENIELENCYLNSGVYIGYAKSIKEMVRFCVEVHKNSNVIDDQLLCQYYIYINKVNIKVDVSDFLFATMANSGNDYDFNGFLVRNKNNGNTPCILHANGDKSFLNGMNSVCRIRKYSNIICKLNLIKTPDERFLCYYNNEIFFSNDSSKMCIIINGVGNKYCIVNQSGKFLSFDGEKNINSTDSHINDWEILSINEGNELITYHGYGLNLLLDYDNSYSFTNIDFSLVNYFTENLVNSIINLSWS